MLIGMLRQIGRSDGDKNIVLIDDINFLLEFNNFKDVLITICKIKDIAIVKNSYVFAVMNKSQIDSRQILMLEKELIPIYENNEKKLGFSRLKFLLEKLKLSVKDEQVC